MRRERLLRFGRVEGTSLCKSQCAHVRRNIAGIGRVAHRYGQAKVPAVLRQRLGEEKTMLRQESSRHTSR